MCHQPKQEGKCAIPPNPEGIGFPRDVSMKVVAEWELGPEYEFAYCSYCGHMQYADWDTHSEAEEMIGTFHEEYKFCPNCGARMKGELKC